MADLAVTAGTYGQIDVGAIDGETPNPHCSLEIINTATDGTLSTGTLATGDAGEFGTLSDATIEFWFRLEAALPSGTRNLLRGPETGALASALWQWLFTITSTGVIAVYFRNNSGTAQTATGGAINIGVWHHIVGVRDGTNALNRIYVDGVTASSLNTGTIQTKNTSTSVGDMLVNDTTQTVNVSFDEIASYRYALSAARVSAHYTAGTSRGFASIIQTGDGAFTFPFVVNRFHDVLDISQSHACPRSIMTGARKVTESYMDGQSPLDELEKALAAENGDAILFVAADGTIKFLDSTHRSSAPYNTVQAKFGDAGGTERPYANVVLDYSAALLINEWTVTRTAGRPDAGTSATVPVPQVASDATSIANNYKHSASIEAPVTADSYALAIANEMLAKFKDMKVRFVSMDLTTDDANTALDALSRDVADKIEILRTVPAHGISSPTRIDQNVWIRRISVRASNDGKPANITFQVSDI